MTSHSRRKARVRDYAKEHGIKYTDALHSLEQPEAESKAKDRTVAECQILFDAMGAT